MRKPPQRKYHFEFRVGGYRHGYDCKIEVVAKNRKGAAIKIRNRIKAMPDVAEVPQFHYEEVIVGLPVLESEGHDDHGYCKQNRPRALRPITHPKIKERA